VTLFSVFNFC